MIAFRTRSRTQSVEREPSSKSASLRKPSRASRSQLISDSDIGDESQEESVVDKSVDKNNSSKKTIVKSRGASSRKSAEKSNSKKKSVDNSAQGGVNSDKNLAQASSRTLRSRAPVDQPSTSSIPRRKAPSTSAASSVVPKKRRVGEQSHQTTSVSRSGLTNPESTGSGSKAPNLGARLARNQSGREPQNTSAGNQQQQEDFSAHASASTSAQQSGHPPQNLLRRSSRGKGASSSSTTGSCVSFSLISFQKHFLDYAISFLLFFSLGFIISFHERCRH